MTPVEPPKKAIGTKTADNTSAMQTKAPVIWFIDFMVASLDESPSSAIRRSTFSTTTMASSTKSPMARTIPNIVSVLIEKPASESTANVPSRNNRNGDGRNQCCPNVLQKKIHHEEHQTDRLNQCFDHFFNRDFEEWRRVVWVFRDNARRKGWLQFFNRRLDGFGGLKRIRAGRQFDRDGGSRFAIILRIG